MDNVISFLVRFLVLVYVGAAHCAEPRTWISFENQPLEEVVATLDTYYTGRVRIYASDTYKDMRISGRFDTNTTLEAIHMIAKTAGLEVVTVESGNIYLIPQHQENSAGKTVY